MIPGPSWLRLIIPLSFGFCSTFVQLLNLLFFSTREKIFLFCFLFQPSLFGNKAPGFGTTTTSAPSFGTGTGLFGNKSTLTLGTGTNNSSFGRRRGFCRSIHVSASFFVPYPFFLSVLQVSVPTRHQEDFLGTRRALVDSVLDWEPPLGQVMTGWEFTILKNK